MNCESEPASALLQFNTVPVAMWGRMIQRIEKSCQQLPMASSVEGFHVQQLLHQPETLCRLLSQALEDNQDSLTESLEQGHPAKSNRLYSQDADVMGPQCFSVFAMLFSMVNSFSAYGQWEESQFLGLPGLQKPLVELSNE